MIVGMTIENIVTMIVGDAIGLIAGMPIGMIVGNTIGMMAGMPVGIIVGMPIGMIAGLPVGLGFGIVVGVIIIVQICIPILRLQQKSLLRLQQKSPIRKMRFAPNAPTSTDKTIPDAPVGFGYKCRWFAVKSDNKNRLAELLELKNISACNWEMGIDHAYSGSVFITPAIDGWTLACGGGLPAGDNKEGIIRVKQILQSLSKEFGEAQFFSTHRVVEYHCWMKATNGKVDRVYSYLGEAGENIAVEGTPTTFERAVNLANTFSDEAKDENYFQREDIVWANEDLLMQIAANWSINPTTLDNRPDINPSLGLIGQR